MAWPLPIAPCAIIQSLPIAPCATTLPQPVAPCAIIPPAHVAPCATALPSPIALCATAPPLPIAPCATDPPPPMAAALPPPPPQHHHTHTVLPPPPPLPTLHNGGMDVAGGGGADEGSSAARAGQGAAVGEAGRQGGGDCGIPIAHRAEVHATCRRCRTRFTLVNYNGPDPTCFPCRQAAGKGAAAQRRMHREHRQAGCPPPIRVGDRATASAQVAAGATVAAAPAQGKVSTQSTAPAQAKARAVAPARAVAAPAAAAPTAAPVATESRAAEQERLNRKLKELAAQDAAKGAARAAPVAAPAAAAPAAAAPAAAAPVAAAPAVAPAAVPALAAGDKGGDVDGRPPAMRMWVQRAFAQCRTDGDREMVHKAARSKIQAVSADDSLGLLASDRLWNYNWAAAPLPPLHVQAPRPSSTATARPPSAARGTVRPSYGLAQPTSQEQRLRQELLARQASNPRAASAPAAAPSTASLVTRDCCNCGEPAIVSTDTAWDAATCTACARARTPPRALTACKNAAHVRGVGSANSASVVGRARCATLGAFPSAILGTGAAQGDGRTNAAGAARPRKGTSALRAASAPPHRCCSTGSASRA